MHEIVTMRPREAITDAVRRGFGEGAYIAQGKLAAHPQLGNVVRPDGECFAVYGYAFPPIIEKWLGGGRLVSGFVLPLTQVVEMLNLGEEVAGLLPRHERALVAFFGDEHHRVRESSRYFCGMARVEWTFATAIRYRGSWKSSSRGPVLARREDGVLEVMWPC